MVRVHRSEWKKPALLSLPGAQRRGNLPRGEGGDRFAPAPRGPFAMTTFLPATVGSREISLVTGTRLPRRPALGRAALTSHEEAS
jgi:hypothetical protein